MVAAGKEVHALSSDARNVHAVDRREVHAAEHLAVHLGVGHRDALRHHGLLLVVLVPLHVYFRTDECLDSLHVGFGADDEQFVAHLEGGVACGDDHVALMAQARADHIAVEEL